MEHLIAQSRAIYENAVEQFKPDFVVAMISGGNDSAAAYHVAKEIGAKIDFILHINTGTGIAETTEFVRDYYGQQGPQYIEADAGDAYERHLFRKGFFGRGSEAHEHAYHILKAGPYRKAISKHMRKGKRGVTVLLLNGARVTESANRSRNLPDVYNRDPSQKKNIWVNMIHPWTKEERDKYLDARAVPINPVTKKLCRSGECMCGTMQSKADRVEASILYPAWGAWINDLEKRVMEKFPWHWGENIPAWFTAWKKHGQRDMFQPMCIGCKNGEEIGE